jgi:signal transduction histidine kinase
MSEPRRPDARDALAQASAGRAPLQSSKRLDATLIAAVVALLVGLVAIHIVVMAALQPPLHELERIGDDHALAVSVATRMHAQLSDLRRRVVSAARAPAPSAALDVGPDFLAIASTVAELLPLSGTDVERRELARLRSAIEACAVTAGRIQGALRAGDVAGARADLAPFLEQASEGSQAADEIVQFNAQQVRQSAERVHRAILWAIAATSVLTALVVAAALVLIRVARRAVGEHARLAELHSSEMGAFASRAAHELRNPLHTLTLSLAALRTGASPRALDRADASARRLRATIEDILELSRSGAAPAADARADVADAVSEVLEDVEWQAEEAHVALGVDVPPALTVKMAPGHLRVVVANVLGNAVKYGAEKAGARVDLTAHVAERGVDIVVRDTGPGIAPDAIAHVFEPFFRASHRAGGYGLGLATVKRIVDAHGGGVDIESAPGVGTTVAIHLPTVEPLASGPTRRAAPPPPGDARAELH